MSAFNSFNWSFQRIVVNKAYYYSRADISNFFNLLASNAKTKEVKDAFEEIRDSFYKNEGE
jgi:hypothetical protein